MTRSVARHALALVVLGVGLTPVAYAAPGGATTVLVDATFSGANNPPDTVVCSEPGAACELYFTGQEQFEGSWEGTDYYYAHGHFREDGVFEFVATHTVVGTVRGCGTGSFSLAEQGEASPKFDLVAGGFPVEADWQVVPGSGSAGLAGLRSGSGTFSFVIHADQSFEDGKTAGTLTCIPPNHR